MALSSLQVAQSIETLATNATPITAIDPAGETDYGH